MGHGLLRRVLAIQSFILGCGILVVLMVFGHIGDDRIETLKAIGVILGLAIYLALCLRVIRLLKAPGADSRTSAIGTFLCLPSLACLAFYLLVQRGA